MVVIYSGLICITENTKTEVEVKDNKDNTPEIQYDDSEKFLRAMRLLKQSRKYIQVTKYVNFALEVGNAYYIFFL